MIKVVHVQNSTESAGRAALRLHTAFLEHNIDSSILSLHPGINDTEKIKNTGLYSKMLSKLDSKLQSFLTRKKLKQFGLYTYPVLGTNISGHPLIKEADVIYLHWVQGGFLNLSDIEKLARLNKPVIFFMHDMWTITGGCHYSFDCEKYTKSCYDCQMFPKNSFIDWAASEFKKKRKLFSKYQNLYFVSPSEWLCNCAKQSSLTKDKPVFYIPNTLNHEIFKPVDKKVARSILNIEINKTVIAFGAVSVDSPYKGWTYAEKALEILKRSQSSRDILILIFGSGHNKRIADSIPFETRFMGYLRDEYSTSLVYNAADVFIAPSLAETFGYVIMEALSCGTPVISFNVGGIPDLIKHRENGFLAKYKDAEDLAMGIQECLNSKIKGYLLPIFGKDRIIKSHIDLINSILS